MTPADSRSIVVHLVHGTWPYGLLNHLIQRRPDRPTPWFEDGSRFRDGIKDRLRHHKSIEFRAFKWSGKNSVNARFDASYEFHDHLNLSLQENDDSLHVIVAHSHGGTVVEQAIRSHISAKRVKALICLATPFAYVREGDEADDSFKMAALGHSISAGLVVAIFLYSAKFMAVHILTAVLLIALQPLVGATVDLALQLIPPKHSNTEQSPLAFSSPIPFFLLRATRDEATLGLGFVQFLSGLLGWLFTNLGYGYTEHQKNYSRPFRTKLLERWRNMRKLYPLGLLILYLLVTSKRTSALPFLLDGFLVVTVLEFAAAVSSIAAFLLIASAVGFWDFTAAIWSNIEVDTVPEFQNCHIKSFGRLRGGEEDSLRHGLYDYADVKAEIAQIIGAVASGDEPRFQTVHWAYVEYES